MLFGRTVILRLYRDLLRYTEQLKYTDKSYYRSYIRNQFEKNRELESEQAIELAFKVPVLVCDFFFFISFCVLFMQKGKVFLEKKRLL